MNFEARTARRGSTAIHLTHREFEICDISRSVGIICRSSRMKGCCATSGELWGSTTRSVDFAVARLRRRFQPNPPEPRFLRTVHGDGYWLTVDRDSS